MYCQHCGAQLPDNAKFCTECGASTKVIVSPEIAEEIKLNKKSRMVKAKKPIYKRVWFWALFIFLFIGIIGNSGDSGNSSETSKPRQTATVNSTPKPTAQPTPEPTEAPVYSLGETVTIHDLEFTVNSFTFSHSAGNLGNLNPSGSDHVYCVVYVTVYNPTNEEKRIVRKMLMGTGIPDYSTDFTYDGEYSYNSSFADYTDFLYANETIMPLAKLSNKILNYKVPNEVQSSGKSIELKISYSSSEYAVWQLR